MRVAIILGSAHGSDGTTGRLVDDLMTRARALEPALEVTTVLTTDLDLGSACPACLTCMTDGEQACPRFDGAAPARVAMGTADLVVFATPVHSFQVSATMKRFIDHFAYLIHRPAHVGQPAVLVSTAAGAGHDAALGYLASAIRRWGFHTAAQLGVNGPGLAKPRYRASVDAALDDLATDLVNHARHSPEPTPTTADLIGFRVARLLVESGREHGPADAAWWDERGWFEADWFSSTRVPWWRNRIAAMVESRIRRGIAQGSAQLHRG